MQIFASPAIFTVVHTELKFWYFLPLDESAQLMVCINGLDNCVWRAYKPKRNLMRWWKQSLQIPSGKNQVFFVILQWKPSSKVGLDGIRLNEIYGNARPAFCQVYSDY